MSHCEWCVKWQISVSEDAAIGVESSAPIWGEASTTQDAVMEVLSSPLAQMRCGILGASPVMEVGIMCMTGMERWLEVTPDEVAWLTEANGWSYDYEVSSNLQWTID